MFELFWAKIAQGRMTTLAVGPALNISENGVFGFSTGSVMGTIDRFGFERSEKLSIGALSK
jgi:hypothetical protein